MTIFINIAAYNDFQLEETLESLYRNTIEPNIIRVGVCWQSDNPFPVQKERVNYIHYGLSEARGVGFARSEAHQFYDGEEFYLTIDAHTLFRPGWNNFLLNSYFRNLIRLSNKLIYSAYAPGWSEYPNGKARKLVPKSQFNDFGVLRFRADKPISQDLIYPPISCHFMFARSQFFLDLPHDANLFYNGEEITYTVRAFTHGWLNVQPGEVYLYHKYNQKENGHPVIWKDNPEWRALNQPSIERVKSICSHEPDNLGEYGKGSVRNLRELETILGVDFTSKTVLKPKEGKG